MKKIIIVNSNLHIGGVQKALINLLKEIDGKYDVTLALFNVTGELQKDIPKSIKILPINSSYRFLGLSKYDVVNNNILKLKRNIYAAITRMFGRNNAIKLMALNQKTITGYDVAISYVHNGADKVFYGGCNDFVLKHIDAPKKITFLHCDYEMCGANTLNNEKQYKKFDVIAACSEGCCKNFLKAIPELRDKTKVVYNCQDYTQIKQMSEEKRIDFQKEKINIITVSRFGKEKAVHRAIEALGECNFDDNKFHYYIIGDGIERTIIEDKIQKYNLENNVTLLGQLDNPYPYIKEADLLLIPSYSEAAPMVIGEAAYLGTPVLSTETSSAKEMIIDTGIGWVCNNSVAGIKERLSVLIDSKELLLEKKKSIKKQQFNNKVPITQFDAVLQDG